MRHGTTSDGELWSSFYVTVSRVLRYPRDCSLPGLCLRNFVCFFFLFVGINPEKLWFSSCDWEGSKPPGSGHAWKETQLGPFLHPYALNAICPPLIYDQSGLELMYGSKKTHLGALTKI